MSARNWRFVLNTSIRQIYLNSTPYVELSQWSTAWTETTVWKDLCLSGLKFRRNIYFIAKALYEIINVRAYFVDCTWCMDYNNSLAPGKFEWNFMYLICQIISVIDGWGIFCELALKWMSLDLTDDKSTMLTQISVTIWRHLAQMS